MIGEATLTSLEVRPGSRRVILRLAVPAGGGPGSPRREWVLLFHGVSRVAAWLRRVQDEAGPYLSGPGRIARVPRGVYHAETVRDGRELNNWLRRWSGHQLSGQPREIFDAADAPVWLGWASVDVAWPQATRGVHTFDLSLGDNASVSRRLLDLRIEFGHLEVLRDHRASPDQRGRRPDAAGPAARHSAPASGVRTRSGGPGSQERPAHRQQPGQNKVTARARRARAAAVLVVLCAALAAWVVVRPGPVAGPPRGTGPAAGACGPAARPAGRRGRPDALAPGGPGQP